MNRIKGAVSAMMSIGFAAVAMADTEANKASAVEACPAVTGTVARTSLPESVVLPKLEGLFGIKFGEMPAGKMRGGVNDDGVWTAAFSPKKPFLGFTDFTVFASPGTRKVFQIQASRAVMPGEEETVMGRVVRMIEFRFDLAAVSKDGNSKVFFFDADDLILVSFRQDRVFIEACCDKLMAVAHGEIAAARDRYERDRFAKDLAALGLELTVESVGEASRPTGVLSVLGRKFGEALVATDGQECLPDGSWSTELRGGVPFAGSQDFTAFASTRTKSVYRVRVLWTDCGDKEKFAYVRRAVEIAMKMPMTENGENACRLELGNIFVTLVRSATKDSIALDFSDKVVYARHQDESKGFQKDEDWRDIGAL